MFKTPTSSKAAENDHHPMLGAIDLGTNSCRLLIASVNVASLKKSFFRRRPNLVGWKIIDSFAKIVRLGEGLHKNNELSSAAIQRALDALKTCRKKIDFHGVTHVRAVATEACRRATNGHILVERAKEELGLDIEIIEGKEEARLALTGCAAILNPKIPYAIVFDIGGGSTEVIWLRLSGNRGRPGYPIPFEVIDSISLPYGVVTISESYAQFAASPEIHRNLRDSVSHELGRFSERNQIQGHINDDSVQLVGSSGTVTTLAAIQVGLKQYERRMIDGLFIKTSRLHFISQKILAMSIPERAQHACIGAGRSDLVVVGSAILEGICDALPIPELRVADRGVREGILSELLVNLS
ncbi:Ppx/GppA phosphatase family protein [Candidatus Finniella inopinata]|uniref:Ppx/GppA family phosphatase n=1 Tax=Candidatus Finniella inopinata TaxID=1696036 RepID=A0A4V2DZP9_9PROT|nr:Ppx/GppA phosphatase family protein [Candidatus Finniella inopinata]RZI45817.1 Ppx/GppA family phosphatase [Candidatus Finniella inopinata]